LIGQLGVQVSPKDSVMRSEKYKSSAGSARAVLPVFRK
jgi:hypothetical protein